MNCTVIRLRLVAKEEEEEVGGGQNRRDDVATSSPKGKLPPVPPKETYDGPSSMILTLEVALRILFVGGLLCVQRLVNFVRHKLNMLFLTPSEEGTFRVSLQKWYGSVDLHRTRRTVAVRILVGRVAMVGGEGADNLAQTLEMIIVIEDKKRVYLLHVKFPPTTHSFLFLPFLASRFKDLAVSL